MPNPKYSPRMIALLVREAGWTQVEIAQELGMSQGAVSHGIQTGASPRVTEWVEKHLQIKAEVLWPQRFVRLVRPKRGKKIPPE